MAEATCRCRGNRPISLSRRETGKSGGRQSRTMAPVRSDASWTSKSEVRHRLTPPVLVWDESGDGHVWSSAVTQTPAQRSKYGVSKLDWAEPGMSYPPETGPLPVTQKLVNKSDNHPGKRDAEAHADLMTHGTSCAPRTSSMQSCGVPFHTVHQDTATTGPSDMWPHGDICRI